MLYGDDRVLGVALVRPPLVKAVGFAGSRPGGRALVDADPARPKPIPVYAEMGGINPVFFLNGALAQKSEELASGLHGSVTLGVGQFSTNPGLILVEAGVAANQFMARMEGLIAATSPGTMLTAGLCAAYRQWICSMVLWIWRMCSAPRLD